VRAVLLSVEEGENGRLQTTGCDEASTGRRWIVSASCSVGIRSLGSHRTTETSRVSPT